MAAITEQKTLHPGESTLDEFDCRLWMNSSIYACITEGTNQPFDIVNGKTKDGTVDNNTEYSAPPQRPAYQYVSQ